MLLVRAAGGLLWRDAPGGPRLAIVHRPRHRDWGLPKGKLERGESFREAALREVEEETRCQPRLGAFAGATFYLAKGRPKVVLFWRMALAEERPFEPDAEVDAIAWLTREQALARLDHASERRLVARELARS